MRNNALNINTDSVVMKRIKINKISKPCDRKKWNPIVANSFSFPSPRTSFALRPMASYRTHCIDSMHSRAPA
jgi:hypothetical protein